MHKAELVMVSQWMENGNITQHLRRNPRVNRLSLVNPSRFSSVRPSADLVEQLADVARGAVYLHAMNIVHGDLKGVKETFPFGERYES